MHGAHPAKLPLEEEKFPAIEQAPTAVAPRNRRMINCAFTMAAQRPVDLILHAGDPLAAVRAGGTRADMRELAVAFHELSSLSETDAVLRCAVELARESIG